MRLTKMLCSLLAAGIVLCAGALSASATSALSLSSGGVAEDKIYLGPESFDSSSDQSGSGWSWDADTHTLELNGYNGGAISIYSSQQPVTFKIKVLGDNTVTNSDDPENSNPESESDAIRCNGNLEISGSGTLNVFNNIASPDDCISAWHDSNSNTSTISIKDTTIVFKGKYGLYSGNLILENCSISGNDLYSPIYSDNITATGSKINFTYTAETSTSIDFICLSNDVDFTDCEISFDLTYTEESNEESEDYILSGNNLNFAGCTINISCKGFMNNIVYSFYAEKNLVFDGCNITLTNNAGEFSETSFYSFDAENITSCNGTVITCNNVNDLFFAYINEVEENALPGRPLPGASEIKGTIDISDTEISGIISGTAFSGVSVNISNSDIDLSSIDKVGIFNSYGFLCDAVSIEDSDVSITAQDTVFCAERLPMTLSLTESSVMFKNIDGDGDILSDTTAYTLNYARPDFWELLIDDAASDYTVASADIDFGIKSLEINYIHEHTPEYIPGDVNTHSVKCTVCEETYIAAEDHTWDAGVITKEAAIGVEGEKTFTCTKCKQTRIEKIAALDDSSSSSVSDSSPKTGASGIAPVVLTAFVMLGAAAIAATKKKKD